MHPLPSRAASRRLVLPVVAVLLAAAVAAVVFALSALQDVEEACFQGELSLSTAPLRARVAERCRSRHAQRGELISDPRTQVEARAMVAFCDTASRADVEALREIALHGENVLAAANAIRALGRLRAVARDPRLVALLRDPRERVRDETILALGESRDREAATPLLESFASGGEPRVRLLAIHALGRLGGDRAAALLREIVADPASPREDLAFARAALASASR